MISLLFALTLQTGQAAKPPPTIYIPTALFEMIYPVQLEPVLATEQLVKARKDSEGGVSHLQWGIKVNSGMSILHYTKFADGNPPKQTLRQRAESMFNISKDFAEGMLKIDAKGDWNKIHEDKFSSRVVSDRKFGTYDGVIDAHEDLRAKTIRRIVAWGDAKEQWVLELSIDNTSASMKDVLAKLIDSVKIKKLAPEEAKSMPMTSQVLTGMDLKIAAPGAFAMFTRPMIDSARPAKRGVTANLPVVDGFDVYIVQDAYGDEVKSNTEAVVNKLLARMKLPGLDVKASKITPMTMSTYSGHALRTDYVQNGVAMYGVSAVLTKAGADLIVHVQIRKDLGGKEKADAILASLKPL